MSTAFTFAFQPIIDISSSRVIAHEALIRGLAGEAADSVLAGFAGDELLKLDHEARITAIRLASSLHVRTGLSLNFSHPESSTVCLTRSMTRLRLLAKWDYSRSN